MFQVKPPTEWSAQSKTVEDDFVLRKIITQKPQKLLYGGIDLGIDFQSSVTYKEFRQSAMKRQHLLLRGRQFDVDICEKKDWKTMSKNKVVYSEDNDSSLFGDDVKLWNLIKFTKAQSNIHDIQVHHNQKVCII